MYNVCFLAIYKRTQYMIAADEEWRIVQRKKFYGPEGYSNSLYFFINDNEVSLLNSQHIIYVHNNEGSRKAYHINVPILGAEQELAENRPVFEGYKLLSTHLTVDLWVKSNIDPLSYCFTPAHAVVEYLKGGSVIKARVYFNRRGDRSSVTAKKYPVNQQNSHPGVHVPLDEKQETLLKIQSHSCFNLLDDLIEKKSKKYIELFQRSFELDKQLTFLRHPSEQTSKEVIRDAAITLRDVTSLISRYDDALEDPRTLEYENIISTLDEEQVEDAASANKDCSRADGEIEDVVEKSSAEIEGEMKANIMVDVIHILQFAVKMDESENLKLVQLSRDLDDKFLTYTTKFNTKSSEDFVAEQRKNLPFKNSVAHYFEFCVMGGDVNNVRLMYPEVARQVDMSKLSKKLIDNILSSTEDNINLIRIADFFFEKSSAYRMTITNILKNQEHGSSSSWLLILYIQDKLNSFCMALRQVGISKRDNSIEVKGMKLSVLDAIVCLYHLNPKLRYIQALFEYGAKLNLTFNFPADTSLANNTLILLLQRQRNKYPELVSELVDLGGINAETLFFALAMCIGPEDCKAIFFISNSTKTPVKFDERDSCVSSLFNQELQSCFYLYLPQDSNLKDKKDRVQVINLLLRKAHLILSAKPQRKTRELMAFLSEHAEKYASFNFHVASQLAYTLIQDPGVADVEAMLRLFIAISICHKTSGSDKTPHLEKVEYENGNNLLRHVRESQKPELLFSRTVVRFEQEYQKFKRTLSSQSVFQPAKDSKKDSCNNDRLSPPL
jgi:hypothetical protein